MKKLIILTCVFLWFIVPGIAGAENAPSADSNIEHVANRFVSLLTQRDFQKARADFDDIMKVQAPPEMLEDVWKSILSDLGEFQKIEASRIETSTPYRFVFVTCRFQKDVIDMKVVIDKSGKIAGFAPEPVQAVQYRTPGYANKNLFQERDVTIGAGEWALPGVLSIPTGKGPFPAVILVHGSGPNDKDETIGPNKPFQDLAWGLASRGIAVLRYEKRTHKYPEKLQGIKNPTVKEETIIDAAEAVSSLQKIEGIDTGKIFILGHSLGGMLAPRIADGNPNIAGLIILAGASRPLEDLMLEQILFKFSLSGELTPDKKMAIERMKSEIAAVKKLSNNSPINGLLLGAPVSYWLDLNTYNPTAVARTLKIPMLILQGERDYQVRMDDFNKWKNTLSSRADVVLKSYPTLNHLFMVVQGQSTGAEYFQASNVAESVIDDIAGWIKKTFGMKGNY